MKLYSQDVKIYGTVYVKADTAKEAATLIRAACTGMSMLVDGGTDEVIVSGKQYDDPDLPSISLSPAMTLSKPIGRPERADD